MYSKKQGRHNARTQQTNVKIGASRQSRQGIENSETRNMQEYEQEIRRRNDDNQQEIYLKFSIDRRTIKTNNQQKKQLS